MSTLASTAQDSTAPLRGPEKKDEEEEEDCHQFRSHVQTTESALVDDLAVEFSPFFGIDKGAVLQEASCIRTAFAGASTLLSQMLALASRYGGALLMYSISDFVSLDLSYSRVLRCLVHDAIVLPVAGHHQASLSAQPGRVVYKGGTISYIIARFLNLRFWMATLPAVLRGVHTCVEGSLRGVFRRDQALPEQGCQSAAHGVSVH
eukprot:355947-Chlamydomonas_euryale.AAC.14